MKRIRKLALPLLLAAMVALMIFALSACEEKADNFLTVSFNSTGGTVVSALKVEIGDEIGELPTPQKTGYTFEGWYVDGEQCFPSYIVSVDVMLIAKWTPTNYTITYEGLPDGQNAAANPATYTINDAVTLVAPTRAGYTFTGWSDDGVIAKGSTGEKIFTASWEIITYSITYNLNGGTIFSPNPETYTVEDEIALSEPTRAGYTFAGWSNGGKINKGSTGNRTFTASWSALFTLSDGTITGYKGMGGNVVIPSSIDGGAITSIDSYAFYNCSSITSVTIPDGVTSIGGFAFVNCISLTSLTIPGSVTIVGNSAFYNCYKLVEVINHSSLNIVEGSSNYGYVAYYASKVHDGEGEIDREICFFDQQGDYLFYTADGVHHLLGYVGTETTLTLPADYKGEQYRINHYAFYNCSSIRDLTIPDSITSIGDYAFYNCTSLTSITFQGTKVQWNAIGKGSYWNQYFDREHKTIPFTVHCTDGNISY